MPLCLDSRFEPDCLFFVFEWDFRFGPTEPGEYYNIPGNRLVPVGDFGPQGGSPSAFEAAPSSAVGDGVPQHSLAQGKFYEIPAGLRGGTTAEPRTEACDLVRICNEAARCGRGDIVWLSWMAANAGQKNVRRKQSIGLGTAAVAVTVRGAARIMEAIHLGRIPNNHWDMVLKGWLLTAQVDAGASYIVPPIGGFAAHESGCTLPQRGTPFFRRSIWGEQWACWGTRPSQDTRNRDKWVCGLTASGPPTFITKVNVTTSPEHDWRTFVEREGAAPTISHAAARSRPLADGALIPAVRGVSPDTKRRKRELRRSLGLLAFRCLVEDESQVSNHHHKKVHIIY